MLERGALQFQAYIHGYIVVRVDTHLCMHTRMYAYTEQVTENDVCAGWDRYCPLYLRHSVLLRVVTSCCPFEAHGSSQL
jgi:hypothetical protein